MSANFHRRKWAVEPKVGTDPAPDILYLDGAKNVFWLDPQAVDNKLAFRAQFDEDDMDPSWGKWQFFAAGKNAFNPATPPDNDTERLEAVRVIGGVNKALRLYIEVKPNGDELLHARLGVPGSGDDGRAIAHPT